MMITIETKESAILMSSWLVRCCLHLYIDGDKYTILLEAFGSIQKGSRSIDRGMGN